ncbi:MAG: VOC family protein [Alphaproteobacteria bacterium]|jgi:methylmalonyl-CoA/ethylmalonyl-CoA epimerase
MHKWIDHVVIRVENLDAAITDYTERLGFTVTDPPKEQPEIGLRRAILGLGSSGTFIELAEPLGEKSALGAALGKRGEGVHLVALAVEDIAAAKADMQARGARVIEAGSQVFLHPSEGHGVMYQLIERKGG